MKAIFKHLTVIFLSVFVFVLTGCSFDNSISTSGRGARVFIKLDKATVQKIKTSSRSAREVGKSLGPDYFITVSLKGEYEEEQTVQIKEEGFVNFAEVPVGKKIYAEAEIYSIEKDEDDAETKKYLYIGTSEEIMVTEGSNNLEIEMEIIRKDNPKDPAQDDPKDTADNDKEEEIQIQVYVDTANGQSYSSTYNSGSQEEPFKRISDALSKIQAEGSPDINWVILIKGETTGEPLGTSGINKNYGHIEIPADITTALAKSILITGATPHENWLEGAVPDDLDTINRGATNSTTSSLASGNTISGSALVINTEVPVTITNLKITGGFGGNGGGINIAENARVSLGDGVLITYNRASAGGAVFNQGKLFIYGTAVIGDKDSSSFADYDSSSVKNGTSANYASTGGGIYNGDTASTIAATTIISHLYLGYRPSDDGSPEVSEWTGGIYFNGASSGGGILNARKSFVYMNSGTIKNNDVKSEGGGIHNIAGRVEMSGGQIIHNRVQHYSSIVRGGGIYNQYEQSVFVMSGGVINENVAWARSGTNAQGGGVYNGGKMFMYGSAVIGNPDKRTQPWFTQGTSEADDTGDYGNLANMGGGIYNANTTDTVGKLYMGYKPDESDMPVEENLSGGVYYNYCKIYYDSGSRIWGGGGIYSYTSGSGEFLLSSGTIAYNATGDDGGGIWMQSTTIAGGGDYGVSIHDNTAEGNGNAIYIYSNQTYTLTLSGDIEIPFDESNPQDIYLSGKNSRILIAGDLNGDFSALITPGVYDTTYQLVGLTTGSTANLEAETQCFFVTPQTKDGGGNDLSVPVEWKIDQNGYLKHLYYGTKSEPDSQGDIVFSDGSAIPYAAGMTLSDEQKKNAIAVIFYDGNQADSNLGDKILGVGLKHSDLLAWCLESAGAYATSITDIVCTPNFSSGAYANSFSGDTDGSDNFEIISETLANEGKDNTDDLDNYPAFAFAINYKDQLIGSETQSRLEGSDFEEGWYLPTLAELWNIWSFRNTLAGAIDLCGGDALEGQSYWSSNQHNTYQTKAFGFAYDSGNTGEATKSEDEGGSACAIRDFKK